jgi:hypothetical protein
MDNTKIFIDTDTEITFIIEKILNARTEKVTVVVPDRASVLTSITGLKLIKRVVDKSNKLLVLVTLDEQGADLARKAGLFVVSRVGEINENVWEILQRAKFDIIKKSRTQPHYIPEALVHEEEDLTLETTPSFVSNNPLKSLLEEDVEIDNRTDESLDAKTKNMNVQETNEITEEEIKYEDDIQEETEVTQVNINLNDIAGPNLRTLDLSEDLQTDEHDGTTVQEAETIKEEPTPRSSFLQRFQAKKEKEENDTQSNRRRKAIDNHGISNLSFNVGKDVGEEKKK